MRKPFTQKRGLVAGLLVGLLPSFTLTYWAFGSAGCQNSAEMAAYMKQWDDLTKRLENTQETSKINLALLQQQAQQATKPDATPQEKAAGETAAKMAEVVQNSQEVIALLKDTLAKMSEEAQKPGANPGEVISAAAPLAGPYAPWVALAGTVVTAATTLVGGWKVGQVQALRKAQPVLQGAADVVASIDQVLANLTPEVSGEVLQRLGKLQTPEARRMVDAVQGTASTAVALPTGRVVAASVTP